MFKRFFFVLLLLSIAASLSAQDIRKISAGKTDLPPIIDIEILFGDPEISGARISPDGKYISFRKPYDGIMNIWVKEFNAPFESARPLTADKKRPLTQYFWSRDSKMILYAQDFGGDENYRIYSVDPTAPAEQKTGVPKPKDLTPIEKVKTYIYDVPENDPAHILIGLNDRDPKYHDVYKLNIKTGEKTLVFKNENEFSGFRFDYNGKLRLATKTSEDGGTEIYSINGNKIKLIYSVNGDEGVGIEDFSEDLNFVYISTNKGDEIDLRRLMLLDIRTGETKLIESDPENEVDFSGIMISKKTKKPILTYYTADRIRYYFKDKNWENTYKDIKNKLPDGEIYIGSMTDDEQKLIVYVTRDVDPGSAYIYDRKTGKSELLYRSRPNLPTEYLSPMTPIKYKARDGLMIPGYVVLPKGLDSKNLPMVIFPHGGPYARDNWGYNPFAQFLANRGYAVLITNFRGSTGYGKKFMNAGNNQWGTGYMQHDLSDGVKYMIEQGIADPKKVVIMGGSYGGYATLAGLAFTPELYAAGVDIVGPSNIITLLKSIPPYWASMRKIFDRRVGNIDNPEDVERLKMQSPLFSASNIKAPLLVIQGANDPRVKQVESDQIVSTLRDLNRSVEYILAKDEGHGFAGKLNRLAMLASIDRFLGKYIGTRYQDKVSDEIENKLKELSVDINTVTVSKTSETEIETAKKSPLPEFTSAMIKPCILNYDLKMNMMGKEISINAKREITKTKDNKINITDEANFQMGTMVEEYIIDGKTLLPLSKISKANGMEYAKFEFTGNGIRGNMQGKEIKLDLTSPVLGDGASTDIALSVVKYKTGFSGYIGVYDNASNVIKYFKIDVPSIESVVVPAGSFECYKITAKDLESNKSDIYWISREEFPKLIKSESNLPASMGGGIAVSELVSVK